MISALLAAALYVAAALWSDAGKFAAAVGRIGPGVLAAVLALSAANYALRAGRWRAFLAALGHRVGWGRAAANYVGGFALTTTPGKAGEAIRSLGLKRRCGVPVVDSLAAFFAERFSDVMALALIAALALPALPHGDALAALAALAVGMALWVAASPGRTAALARALARVLPHHFATPFTSLAGQAGRLTRGAPLVLGTLLAIVSWSAEAWALHAIVAAMGAQVGVALAMGIYAAALLGGAVFFLPGGLGSTEAILFALLLRAGLDPVSAAAATVVSRVTTLWFAVVLGWIVLALER